MRNGKRLLALNLALLLVVVLLPLQALAAEITLDKPITVTRAEDVPNESVTFIPPETGFYQLDLTCPDYPGYKVTTSDTSDAGLHVYAGRQVQGTYGMSFRYLDGSGLDPLYLLEKGTNYSFGTLVYKDWNNHGSDYYGDWTWTISRAEPQALTLGEAVADTVHLYSYTAQRDGAIQIQRTDWYGGNVCKVYSDTYEELASLTWQYGNGVCWLAVEAGRTYYIADSIPTGEISVMTAPRSGDLGDHKDIHWSLSDDGVLTISGTDTSITFPSTTPWNGYADEIKKIVFEDNAEVYTNWYFGLPNLQDMDVSGSPDFVWRGDALYQKYENGDETTYSLVWVRPAAKTLDVGEDVTYMWFNAFQNASGLETLTLRSDADAGMENYGLLNGATALKDIYYYPENLEHTPFYGIEPVVELNYKTPAPVVHYMAADQELPKTVTKTYPATRIGMAEMLFDYLECREEDYPGDVIAENYTDVSGLTPKQLCAIRMIFDRNITDGTSETTFGPELTCTRAHAATLLYRALKDRYPIIDSYEVYDDVSEQNYYYESAYWCDSCPFVTLDGITGRTFGPEVEQKAFTITTFVLTKDGVEYITGDKLITVIPNTHQHDTELRNAKAATCTAKGYTGDQVCKVCGEIVKQGSAIPAKGHSWGAWKETKPATEKAEGVETRTCSVCGKTETRSIPKLDPKPSPKPDDTKPAPKPIENPFVDVASGDYFYDPVLWALTHEPQITDGMTETTFAPGETCTRGQVVTFLWRAMGCAEPKSANNPFSDVAGGDYFYKAVLWAVEKGITDGTSATTFSPNDPCTRAHVVTFLHRAEGTPAAGSKNPFTDVAAGEYFTDAVLWAVSKGITDGTSDTTFSPADPCTRGQIVTFLYRDMK